LITLLQSIKTVSLEALATTLPIPLDLKVEEREYRDFVHYLLTIDKVWLPIVRHG